MVKIIPLNKRISRELRSNTTRYGSLFFLLVLGMAVIVGLSVATDSIIYSVEKSNAEHCVEDGNFSMIEPLQADDLAEIEELGISVEESSYIDILLPDDTQLRIFRNREQINLVSLGEGGLAAKDKELVLEKHYAKVHNYKTGSSLEIGGEMFTVSGIGTAPDYNFVKRNLTDVGSDTRVFSVGFVSAESYDAIKACSAVLVSEVHAYSYILNDIMTDKEFKDYLVKFTFDPKQIANEYLQEVIDRIESDKNKLVTGVNDLVEGGKELEASIRKFVDASAEMRDALSSFEDGIKEILNGVGDMREGVETLRESHIDLTNALNTMFDALLENASQKLRDIGLDKTLTRENYRRELNALLASGQLTRIQEDSVRTLRSDLDEYDTFYRGIQDYTSGVSEAYAGSSKLREGAKELDDNTLLLMDNLSTLDKSSSELINGAEKIFDALLENANTQLSDSGIPIKLTRDECVEQLEGLKSTPIIIKSDELTQSKKMLEEYRDFYDGVVQYTGAVSALNRASGDLTKGTAELSQGSEGLSGGLKILQDNNDDLLQASDSVFDALLGAASSQLKAAGIDVVLTQGNYRQLLETILASGVLSPVQEIAIRTLYNDLDNYNTFYLGIQDYTSGVSEAYASSRLLLSGTQGAANGVFQFSNELNSLNRNSSGLAAGAGQVYDFLIESIKEKLSDLGIHLTLTRSNCVEQLNSLSTTPVYIESKELAQLKESLEAYQEFYNGVIEYTTAVSLISDAVSDFKDGTAEIYSGSIDLEDGIKTLQSKNEDLQNASESVFDALLKTASNKLKEAGIDSSLTMGNYPSTLDNLLADGIISQKTDAILKDLIHQFDDYRKFQDGFLEYMDGVNEIYDGILELEDAIAEALDGSIEAQDAAQEFVDNGAELQDGATELTDGLREMKRDVDRITDDFFNFKYQNLSTFTPNGENARINDYREDATINKSAAIIIGVVFLLLVAYVVAVFVVENIEKDSAIIGTLYALGYMKKELTRHFLVLPVALVGIGGVVGTIVGVLISPVLTVESSSLYSYAPLSRIVPPYLFVYGALLPVLIALLVNITQISSKLSQTPLKMLRGEKDRKQTKNLSLGSVSYMNKYRVRQFIREYRSHIVLFFGQFLSIVLLVFGFTIYGSMDNMSKQITQDVKFQYMYLLKYPPKEAPKDGEPCYTESLYTNFALTGLSMEVTIQGLREDNPYFDFKAVGGKNEIYISTSAQQKFGWDIGNQIVLYDHLNGRDYVFYVKDVVSYANGLYVFMNIDSMRELFSEADDYYNTLLSNQELDVESGRILSTTTVKDIQKVADTFLGLMSGLISIIIGASIILYVVVFYLLSKMMIDKSTFSISLLKVLGYNEKEVGRLYLGSNWITVSIAAVIGVPVSKVVVDAAYPYMVTNVAMGFDNSLSVFIYALIFLIIAGSYFAVNLLLNRHLRKVRLAEILKSRE